MKLTLARAAIIGNIALTQGSDALVGDIIARGAQEGRNLESGDPDDRKQKEKAQDDAATLGEKFHDVQDIVKELRQDATPKGRMESKATDLEEVLHQVEFFISNVGEQAKKDVSELPKDNTETDGDSRSTKGDGGDNENCVDKRKDQPGCEYYQTVDGPDYCIKDNDPIDVNSRTGEKMGWFGWMERNCQKTCQFCGETKNKIVHDPTTPKPSKPSGGKAHNGGSKNTHDGFKFKNEKLYMEYYRPSDKLIDGQREEDKLEETRKRTDFTVMEEKMIMEHNIVRCMFGAPPLSWNTAIAELTQKKTELVFESAKRGSGLSHEEHNVGRENYGRLWNQRVPPWYINGKFEEQGFGPWTNMGENIASTGLEKYGPAEDASARWAAEYDGKNNINAHSMDHWTQMVWLSSTDVGCGVVDSDGGDNARGGLTQGMLVCNFYPAGNLPSDWLNQKPKKGCVNPLKMCEEEFNYKLSHANNVAWEESCRKESR